MCSDWGESPHNGTAIAYASLRPGCVQMRPNSAFLQDLNRDVAMLKQLNFTSIWTPYDLMIVPAHSSRLPLGTEVIVPSKLHPWMLTDSRCLAAVAEALSQTPINCVDPEGLLSSRHRQFSHTQDSQKSLLDNDNT
jgi:triacylglycerol lipase